MHGGHCDGLCNLVGWSMVVQVIGFSLNPLTRRSGSNGRLVAISVSWALSSVDRALAQGHWFKPGIAHFSSYA